MPSTALAEFFYYTLGGILDEMKGKWFWISIILIVGLTVGLIIYFN